MITSHPDAIEAWTGTEAELFTDVFQPAPHLTPSEWAEQHRIITQGPMRGQAWSNAMTPYLVEILDFIGAPWARRGVVRKSARIGFTEGVLVNGFGWTVAMDPCPVAIVQPTDEEAKGFSKENLTPFLELNPIVGARLGSMGIRDADATITFKRFPGGFLSVLGSVADTNMRRRSFRRVFVDEVDGMKLDGGEGDPLLRFQKRTDDFVDDAAVMLVGSTPHLKHLSRIDREFAKSDQRFWHVPCPHCSELLVLRWGGPDTPYGVKWEREVCCKGCGVVVEDGPEKCPDCGRAEFTTRHLPETAYYRCEHCGEGIAESDREAMVQGGRFIATNPMGEIPGWHLDALISLMPAARWAVLAAEFIAATKDASDLQVFWNTVLGLSWEERGEKIEVAALEARAIEYTDAAGAVVDVPDGVGVLTAFVDVQGSWLELLVRGWGLEEESWDILHQRITGPPDSAATWAALDGFLIRRYRNVHGVQLPIFFTLVDVGAYHDAACSFVKPREARNVFGSIGDRSGGPDHVPVKKPTKANAQGAKIWTIGTYRMKTALFRRLALTTVGPRYMHLRAYNGERCNGFDAEYFAQFESEKRVVRRVKGSQKAKAMYVQTRERNEAIDLHVGNMAALIASGLGIRENLPGFVEAARRPPAPEAETAERPRRDAGEDGWATGGGKWGSW